MKMFRFLPVFALAIVGSLLTAQSTTSAKPTTAAAASATAHRNDPLDINTASPDQLMQLPGVGEAYSKRIIDGRPYTAKNQLVSRGILPKATYDDISPQIIAKHPAKAK